MSYHFSPGRNAFYASELRQDYGAAWPSDAVKVDDACFEEFALGEAPAGKCRGVAGGVPTWVDITPPALSAAQLIGACEDGLMRALNLGAQSWGYDSIISAASYANSTNSRFKAEAKALIAWRDASWVWAQGVLDAAKAGAVPPESVDAFLADAPPIPTRPTN